jgi:diadenylate cyclase
VIPLLETYRASPIDTATWADWVDILVLTFLIYRLLLALRGTRGQQVGVGMMLVGGVYALSKLGGLSTLAWVFDSLAVYIALAVIILFQEDIRRALARAGGSFFRSSGPPSAAKTREQVIQAVFSLAHRKIGALIVFERNASLAPFTEGAHTLDADVSSELLQAVFHPSSLLHDGAVVVREMKILAAGVFVPISMSKDISRSYGTRHRAAIGLTETTDAVCIIVSEERGTVALSKGGRMIPVADSDELRALLHEKLEEVDATEVAVLPGAGVARA